jgi:hypothetical protein
MKGVLTIGEALSPQKRTSLLNMDFFSFSLFCWSFFPPGSGYCRTKSKSMGIHKTALCVSIGFIPALFLCNIDKAATCHKERRKIKREEREVPAIRLW